MEVQALWVPDCSGEGMGSDLSTQSYILKAGEKYLVFIFLWRKHSLLKKKKQSRKKKKTPSHLSEIIIREQTGVILNKGDIIRKKGTQKKWLKWIRVFVIWYGKLKFCFLFWKMSKDWKKPVFEENNFHRNWKKKLR